MSAAENERIVRVRNARHDRIAGQAACRNRSRKRHCLRCRHDTVVEIRRLTNGGHEVKIRLTEQAEEN